MRINTNRRTILKGTAGVGLAGLAGCLGGEGGSGNGSNISVGHTGEGSIGGGVALSIQRIMGEHSDEINFTPEGTGGDPSSVRLITQNELDGAVMGAYTILFAEEGITPFAERQPDPSTLPLQCFSGAIMNMLWLTREDSNVETTDDIINSDVSVWPLDPEWGIHALLRQILDSVELDSGETYWENIEDRTVNVSSGDAAGALEEGRIDVTVTLGSSFRGLPGYTAEQDARANLQAVEIGDSILQAYEDHPALQVDSTNLDNFGFEQDLGTDEMSIGSTPHTLWLTEDISADTVYEIMTTVYENGDMHLDTAQTNVDVNNVENMAYVFGDFPFHPGARDFFEEHDLWEDDYEVGR